jgi:5-carboxymethyl-2-hydroxymuconate isomerase
MIATLVDRDYVGEMRERMDHALAQNPTRTRREISDQLVAQLRVEDPDLLAGWLDAQAEQICREVIGHIELSVRAYQYATAGRRVFRAAVDSAAAGDLTSLASFLDASFVVDPERTRKRLRDMTATDLAFVAGLHEDLARQNTLRAVFMRELEKQCRAKKATVGELYDDIQLSKMWHSLTA